VFDPAGIVDLHRHCDRHIHDNDLALIWEKRKN
jgi:hypothetical protein